MSGKELSTASLVFTVVVVYGIIGYACWGLYGPWGLAIPLGFFAFIAVFALLNRSKDP